MPDESPPSPVRDRPYCRESFDLPCAIEKQLRESPSEENPGLAHAPDEEIGGHLAGPVLCLAAALRLRFAQLAASAGAAVELVVQEDADAGLLPDEHEALLQIAEQAVAQVAREGSTILRVMLRRSRLGPAELSVAGEGGVLRANEAAASYRALATIRQLATQVGARLNVRRLDAGGLFIRCSTRWV